MCLQSLIGAGNFLTARSCRCSFIKSLSISGVRDRLKLPGCPSAEDFERHKRVYQLGTNRNGLVEASCSERKGQGYRRWDDHMIIKMDLLSLNIEDAEPADEEVSLTGAFLCMRGCTFESVGLLEFRHAMQMQNPTLSECNFCL